MVASTPHGHSLEAIVRARGVSGNYFALLGVSPLLGWALTPEDDSQPGSGGPAGPTVVIGYEFWNRTFSRTPSILGARLTLNGTAFTVVGVMPREFFGESVGERPDLWFPLLAQPNIAPGGTKWFDGRTTGWLNVVGRVKPGMTVAEAGSDIDVIFRQYRAADFGGWITPPTPKQDY